MLSLHFLPKTLQRQYSITSWKLLFVNLLVPHHPPMADVFDRKKRSQIMASIRGSGTSIERSLSRRLRELGINPRCHQKNLPGSPDFVLYRQKVVIFTNGCFWHGHQKCKRAVLPTTNRAFWESKVSKNIRRDRKQPRLLRKMGWRVITFWSCKKISVQNLTARLRRVGVKISAGRTSGVIA